MKAPDGMSVYGRQIRKGQIIRLRSIPWVNPDDGKKIIEFMDAVLDKDSNVLEFGSGGSTVWFAKKANSVVAFEHNPVWHRAVIEKLERMKLENAKVVLAPEYPRGIFRYLSKDTYDLILNDGKRRPECCRYAMAALKRGGYFITQDGSNVPTMRQRRMMNEAGWMRIPIIEGKRAAWRKR